MSLTEKLTKVAQIAKPLASKIATVIEVEESKCNKVIAELAEALTQLTLSHGTYWNAVHEETLHKKVDSFTPLEEKERRYKAQWRKANTLIEQLKSNCKS